MPIRKSNGKVYKYDSGIVNINVEGWDALVERIDETAGLASDVANKAAGKLAAYGRKELISEEGKVLHFGRAWSKKEGEAPVSHSVWDPQSKGWVSKTAEANGKSKQIVGFSWQNKANSRSKHKNGRSNRNQSALARSYIYSRTANLFAKSTKPYSKSSPWLWDEKGDKWRVYRGYVRPAIIKTHNAETVAKHMGRAISETDAWLQNQLNATKGNV